MKVPGKPNEKELFLQIDSGPKDKFRWLCFGTQKNINILCKSKRFMSDGSFTRPKVYKKGQLITICAQVQGKYLKPCLHILMPRRHKTLYKRVLRTIKKKLCKVFTHTL